MLQQCRTFLTYSALTLVLSACTLLRLDTGYEHDPELERQILQQGERTLPEVELLALNSEIESYLAEHVDPDMTRWGTVQRLQELLFSAEYLDIQYDDEATLTAVEVFEQGRANCLALVNLYIAMARHFDLQANYQTIQVRPQWNRRGELVVLSEHINALGQLSGRREYVVDFTPDVRLQQHTSRVIEDEAAVALYFNNLGVEYLVANEPDKALEYFQYALMVNEELSFGWSNLGSAWNRLGNRQFAEYSYKKAFDQDRGNTTAINNLARHYSNNGEEERADDYRRALDRVHRSNPYYHFAQGSLAYEREQFEEARRHFRRALRRKDTEPDFYYALGQTYERLGEADQAEELRTIALALREHTDERYTAGSERLRIIENRDTILRSGSAGFTIEVSQ